MNWLRNEHLLINEHASNTQSFGFVSKGNLNRSDKILCFTIRINSQCPVCKSRPHMFNIYARSFYFSSPFRQDWVFSAFWNTKELEFLILSLVKIFREVSVATGSNDSIAKLKACSKKRKNRKFRLAVWEQMS